MRQAPAPSQLFQYSNPGAGDIGPGNPALAPSKNSNLLINTLGAKAFRVRPVGMKVQPLSDVSGVASMRFPPMPVMVERVGTQRTTFVVVDSGDLIAVDGATQLRIIPSQDTEGFNATADYLFDFAENDLDVQCMQGADTPVFEFEVALTAGLGQGGVPPNPPNVGNIVGVRVFPHYKAIRLGGLAPNQAVTIYVRDFNQIWGPGLGIVPVTSQIVFDMEAILGGAPCAQNDMVNGQIDPTQASRITVVGTNLPTYSTVRIEC